MSKSTVKIGNWIWMLYPLIVVALVFYSANYFLGSGELNLLKLVAKSEETAAAEKVVAELETKVQLLKQINKDEALAQMQQLLVAMPASKKAWLLVAQLQQSATFSASALSGYKAIVGDVKEASESSESDVTYNSPLSVKADFELDNFDQMVSILRELNSYTPLVKVSRVEYDGGQTTISIESAWLAWRTLGALDIGAPVANYKPAVDMAINSISSLKEISASETSTVSQVATGDEEVMMEETTEAGI